MREQMRREEIPEEADIPKRREHDRVVGGK
jgi:hypothetical protein